MDGMLPGYLACVDLRGPFRCKPEEFRIAQTIIDHHLRMLQALPAAQGEQSGITWPRPHKIADPPGGSTDSFG